MHNVDKAANPRIIYVFMYVPTTSQSLKERMFYKEVMSGEHLNTGKQDNFRCLQ